MKFKEYLENLNKLAEGNPEVLNYDVISSKDDEGNGYNVVHYEPSVGVFDGEYNGDFVSSESEDFKHEYDYTNKDVNSICIN